MFDSNVLTKDGLQPVKALELCDRDEIFLDGDLSRFVRGSNRKKPSLLRFPLFLDTETSHNHDKENPKAWIYQFAIKFGALYLTGRTPGDLIEWLKFIAEGMELNDQRKAVIYVHNLSYDMQYIKNYLIENSETFNVLAIKSHKILQIETDHYIFKCSWLLSNRSLDAWCKACDSYHIKAVDTIDYDVIRYQDDELTADDWMYQLSDVACMEDCYNVECGEQFNIQTIPLTSTGFVRFDGRKLFREDKNNRKQFHEQRLDVETYERCRDAFMGGYTHGNRLYRGKRVKGNIKHRDYRSFYPSTTRVDYYPSGKLTLFYRHGEDEDDETLENDLKIMLDTKCCLLTVLLEDGKLDPSVTAPILSEYKVFKNRLNNVHIIKDNGRVLEFKGVTVLHLTELDYKWIMEQYTFKNVKILEMYIADRKPLPNWFIKLTDKYFLNKNTLKHSDPLEYMKSKNKLNGIYGMSATDICREEWQMNPDTGEWSSKEGNVAESLDKYYNSRNSFMSYQVALWVTGHCRDRLLTSIKMIGYDRFLYADTDSIFYIGDDETERKVAKMNEDNYKLCMDIGAYIVDNDGNKVEYMAFEDENDDITEFKFLHAKCYGLISRGELKITVAGVTSKWRSDKTKTREMELGDLDNLENGFTFKECGGTTSAYVEDKPHEELIDGHIVQLASACIIRDVEYTIKDVYDIWILDAECIDD